MSGTEKITVDGFDTTATLERMKLIERGYPFSTLYPSDIANILEALRNEQARSDPKPLTLEELRERISKEVWIKDTVKGEVEHLRIDRFEPSYWFDGQEDIRFEQFGTDTGIIRWCCKCGVNWNAYDYPPKEDTE